MNVQLKISVIMVDGSFRERFHIIDCLNNQTLSRDNYEIIWVEFFQNVKEEIRNKNGVKIITLGNSADTEYHSSYCFNEGIRRSEGDVLVIPDADVMVEETFLKAILEEHEKCKNLVMYFHRHNEPEDEHDKSQSYTLKHLKRVGVHTTPDNYGGCLTVRKRWLLEVNGYEQDPWFSSGYHSNGYDLYTRFKNLGLHIMWHPTERLYHPWHAYPSGGRERYSIQTSIINKRRHNLTTLPNVGVDPSRDKAVKEIPDYEYGKSITTQLRKHISRIFQKVRIFL